MTTNKEVVKVAEPEITFWDNLKKSFQLSLVNIQVFLLWIIEVWPQLLAFAILIAIAWRKIRKYLQEEEPQKSV